MKVALYARVSTRDGRQFTQNQLDGMRRYALFRGWEIVREYVDRATGSKGAAGRDELAALMADAYARHFDVVLVWALDRFTREGVLEAFQYIARLKASGVEFRSVTEEHFQTSGPAGELFLAVAAWMAKQGTTLRPAPRFENAPLSPNGIRRPRPSAARCTGKLLTRPRA